MPPDPMQLSQNPTNPPTRQGRPNATAISHASASTGLRLTAANRRIAASSNPPAPSSQADIPSEWLRQSVDLLLDAADLIEETSSSPKPTANAPSRQGPPSRSTVRATLTAQRPPPSQGTFRHQPYPLPSSYQSRNTYGQQRRQSGLTFPVADGNLQHVPIDTARARPPVAFTTLQASNVPRRRPAPGFPAPPRPSVQQSERPVRTMSIQEELNRWDEENEQRNREEREARRRESARGFEGFERITYGGGN